MSRTRALSTTLLFAALPLFGCGPEEDTRLFDEEGVWTLTQFDLGGQGLTAVDNNSRKDAFLLKMDSTRRIGAAAACGNGDNFSVNSSLCKTLPEDAREWQCTCFRYDYDDDVMTAIVFPNEGPIPPKPSTGMENENGDVAVDIQLNVNESVANSYIFAPLPKGVFDSDGEISRYVFQQRAPGAFDETGCQEICMGE